MVRGIALSLVLGAGLAACTADGLPSLTAATGSVTTDPSLAPPGSSQPPKPAFNPFSEQPVEQPSRVVIAHPTLEQVNKTGTLPEFSIGRADAPVTIIKYASLTCPYCKRFMAEVFPALKRDYIDTGKVRFIIREFPIGKTSGTATIALRCAPMKDYLTLYRRYLEQQAHWVSQEVRLDPIYKVAQGVGLSRAQFDSCLQNQAMIGALKWIKERGRELGVIGTPNFFINGRLVKKALGLQELRAIVDPLLTGSLAAHSVPTPR